MGPSEEATRTMAERSRPEVTHAPGTTGLTVLVAAVLLSGCAHGPKPPTSGMGTLVVRVVDERGNRVAALVSLEGVRQETLTPKGTHWFALLLPGAYVPLVKTAFQDVKFKESVRVHEGRVTEVELIVPDSAIRFPRLPPPAAPVETRTGTIQGTVVDEDGRPLQWANITVINARRGGQTDSKGHYLIQGVPIGAHAVRVRMVGFEKEDRKDVGVSESDTTTVDFKLQPRAMKIIPVETRD